MQLTKKQKKTLQFRGKLEKPVKEDRPEKPSEEKSDAEAKKPIDGEKAPPKKKFERKVSSTGNAIRYIVFVGNIPFKTTADELKWFMKEANPVSVRLMTDKVTGKSRGFAFVELGTSTDMKRALDYHHRLLGTKSINVELTAGGGGNSESRKNKLEVRRKDLEKERSKRRRVDMEESQSQYAEEPDHGVPAEQGEKKAKKPNRRKRGRGSH
ncbi:hypothetical protein LPJ78_004771 [Coemansia sp. RSA 989]|nr:hypothetical protein LPJ78_004771 [Coemansia sp. RSA 989]KAJ1870737.1 hypothetical protein LPJ55_004449 [Coemansia sp. RSA 990]KAJ2668299.1 hypothetical protein IWW42_005317 [Coemansia sp. RSA 1085]